MRVLVTGAAGFIGSHLCDRLLSQDHEVVGVDNLLTGRRENLAHLDGHPSFQFLEADVTTGVKVDGRFEAVLHFASPASPLDFDRYPVQILEAGAKGTQEMLELARGFGAHFLLASSSEVYGDPLEHPQRENYRGNVNPVGPRGVYDEAKRFAEALTAAYRRHLGVDVRIARIFNTYGPRMRLDDGRAVPNFLGQALRGEPVTVYGDGSQTRSFCFIDDMVDGVVRLLGATDSRPVNLGNPREVTILELAEMINDLTGNAAGFVHRPLPEDDPKIRRPEVSRARKLLGWEARISLEDGLSRTSDWFRASVHG
ncbi:MAG: UDP-glucuronic acid decarboxylase family protein [Anaerolineae bacterium]